MSISAVPSHPEEGQRAYFRIPFEGTLEGEVLEVGRTYKIEELDTGEVHEVVHSEVWRADMR